MSSGEVVWRGHGSLPGDDGWVSLHLADAAHLTLTPPEVVELTDDERAVLDALEGGGAYFFRSLSTRVGLGDGELGDALWSLLWSGRVTNDTIAPLRALLAGGRTAHKRAAAGPRSTRYAGRRGSLGRFGSLRGPAGRHEPGPGRGCGGRGDVARRWPRVGRSGPGPRPASAVGPCCPPAESDPTVRAVTNAELLLDRYGVLTRGSVVTEDVPGGFAAVYRVLAAAEEAGKVRRGYFVEGLGASQFASTGAVDRLRSMSRLPGGSSDASAGGAGTRPGGRARREPDRQRSSSPPAIPPTPTARPSDGPSAASPTPPTSARRKGHRSPGGARATSRPQGRRSSSRRRRARALRRARRQDDALLVRRP